MSTDTNTKSFPCWTDSSTLTVEPEFPDNPELAGVYMDIKEADARTSWATNDPAVAKQLIEHIAKLAHLTVTIGGSEPKIEEDQFNVGDRVQVLPGRWGKAGTGTVEFIDPAGPFSVAVRFDEYPASEGWAPARFSPDELTKNF